MTRFVLDIDESNPPSTSADPPDAIPANRCCMIVRCRHAEQVCLVKASDPTRNRIMFSEVLAGYWVAWLVLNPGNHQWLLTARRKPQTPRQPAPVIQRRILLHVPHPIGVNRTNLQIWITPSPR
ncbi:MAG: hypothetical protein ACYC26_03285 [Phycisphaerales bacterium]